MVKLATWGGVKRLKQLTQAIFSVPPAAQWGSVTLWTKQGTISLQLIVLLWGPGVFASSHGKFTALSHLQSLNIVRLLPLSFYRSPEQRPSCSNSNYSLISWGISAGLIGFKWTPKIFFVTENNMQGFLIKIRCKPTWRFWCCFHVLLFKKRLGLTRWTVWCRIWHSGYLLALFPPESVYMVVYQERWWS